jgi:hypothetical protein
MLPESILENNSKMVGDKSDEKMEIMRHAMDNPMGAFNLFERKISYYYELDRFPELKRMVLEHEQGHATDKNMLQVLIRETKDYVRIYCSKEYMEFYDYQSKKHKWWQHLLLNFANMVYGFYVLILYNLSHLLAFFVMIYRRVKNG